MREQSLEAGPATQRYMSARQASLPDDATIQTPEDATCRQLQSIDQQEEAMQADQEAADKTNNAEYHAIRVYARGSGGPASAESVRLKAGA